MVRWIVLRAALVCLTVLSVAAPAGVSAQAPGRVFTVGLFHVGLDHDPPSLAPLRDMLRRLGWEEGRNIRLDYRNQASEETARATARDFVQKRVDLIVAFESQAVRAAKAATAAIPIVFVHVSDPVAAGYVNSVARPGGNLTGVADLLGELQDKRMQILGEMVALRRLLVLTDPSDPNTARLLAAVAAAARQLKVQLVERQATTETDVTRLFAAIKKGDVDGLIVVSPNLMTNHSTLILRLSLERGVPMAYHRQVLAQQGALFTYGPDFLAVAQDLASYVDRILKGARPADLPVQQTARLQFTINMKTARALGITVPPALRLQATSIIE